MEPTRLDSVRPLSRRLRCARPRGFTLVELLVVVAIIALLVTILAPSLGRAKDLAQSTVCKVHLKGAGQAMRVYTSEWNGWLAGPNTSGYHLSLHYENYGGGDETPTTEPTQNMDWVSPTLGKAFGLPKERRERLVQILNTDLRCPANKEYYSGTAPGDGQGSLGDADPETIRYSSFSAALAFHVKGRKKQVFDRDIMNHQDVRPMVVVPDDYTPRLAAVGTPSRKVYAMDGARYVNSDTTATFNFWLRQRKGGNFMEYGPGIALGSGTPYSLDMTGEEPTLRARNLRFAYRHSERINAIFFDAHAETLDLEESLDVEMYFPKGSYIRSAGLTQDPNDHNGEID